MNHATTTPSGLVRALGPWLATAVVVGTIIGSGVFVKPRAVAEGVQFFGLAAAVWTVGGLLSLLGALTYAEVVAMFPRAGGNYVLLGEAYGRVFAFLWGWVDFCIIRTAAMAALATVFTESLHDVVKNPVVQQQFGLAPGTELTFWSQKLTAVVVILGLALINLRGVSWGGGLNFFVTLIKMGTLLAILVLPFLVWGRTTSDGQPNLDNLQPSLPSDWSTLSLAGINSALLGVLFAYHGWGNLAPLAEEVRDPGRNIPLALVTGVGIVTLLYLGANLAYALVIPQSEMAALQDTTVATQFSMRLLGPIGGAATAAAIMCSVFGALNGNVLVGPRLLFAMGRDGMLPRTFGLVHARYHTPVLATLVVAGWASGLVLTVALLQWFELLSSAKSAFDRLTDYAMFGSMTFETLGVLSIFVFRRTRPNADRPYRCWGYPVVPFLFGLVSLFILGNMFHGQPVEALAGMGFIAVGVTVYFALGLQRSANHSRPEANAQG